MKLENYLKRKLIHVYWAGFREAHRRMETDDDGLPEEVLIEYRKVSIDETIKDMLKWFKGHNYG